MPSPRPRPQQPGRGDAGTSRLSFARACINREAAAARKPPRGRAPQGEGLPAGPGIPRGGWGAARRVTPSLGARPGPEVRSRCRGATCGASGSGTPPRVAGETPRGPPALCRPGGRTPTPSGGPLPLLHPPCRPAPWKPVWGETEQRGGFRGMEPGVEAIAQSTGRCPAGGRLLISHLERGSQSPGLLVLAWWEIWGPSSAMAPLQFLHL